MSEVRWFERRWRAMGSDAHLLVATSDEQLGGRAIAHVERLERCWSRFRADSELVAMNESGSDEVPVSPTLAAALHRAVTAYELTDGWFDPTVLGSLEAAGYDRSFTPGGAPRGRPLTRPAPTAREVQVDLGAGTVRRPVGIRFDLGGIGKGLAADLVATQLVDEGARAVCVSLGGDVRVAGRPPPGGWAVPVLRPDTGATWFTATLARGALATSTTSIRRWTTLHGATAHHLIDPGTGRPSESPTTTSVVAAAETWWAEVLAKAALLAGPDAGRRLLERHGAQGWFDPPADTGSERKLATQAG